MAKALILIGTKTNLHPMTCSETAQSKAQIA